MAFPWNWRRHFVPLGILPLVGTGLAAAFALSVAAAITAWAPGWPIPTWLPLLIVLVAAGAWAVTFLRTALDMPLWLRAGEVLAWMCIVAGMHAAFSDGHSGASQAQVRAFGSLHTLPAWWLPAIAALTAWLSGTTLGRAGAWLRPDLDPSFRPPKPLVERLSLEESHRTTYAARLFAAGAALTLTCARRLVLWVGALAILADYGGREAAPLLLAGSATVVCGLAVAAAVQFIASDRAWEMANADVAAGIPRRWVAGGAGAVAGAVLVAWLLPAGLSPLSRLPWVSWMNAVAGLFGRGFADPAFNAVPRGLPPLPIANPFVPGNDGPSGMDLGWLIYFLAGLVVAAAAVYGLARLGLMLLEWVWRTERERSRSLWWLLGRLLGYVLAWPWLLWRALRRRLAARADSRVIELAAGRAGRQGAARGARIALPQEPTWVVRRLFGRLIRLGQRRGIIRAGAETAREYGRKLGTSYPGAGDGADRLAELYAQARYAGRPLGFESVRQALHWFRETGRSLRRR